MENNNFYTFSMIKPDAMDNRKEIIKLILNSGLKIDYAKVVNLDDEIIEKHYAHCKDKDFYPEMKKNLQSGPVILLLIYDKNGNAALKFREILGATKSWEAKPNTIRGMFGNKEIACKNAAHGSGNSIEAKEEIERFFKDDMALILESIINERKKEYEQSMTGVNLNKKRKIYTDFYFECKTIDKIEEEYNGFVYKKEI